MKQFFSSAMTGIWSSLLVVLILFVGFAIGLLTWSRDLGWVSSVAALAAVLLGLYLVVREYVEDADRAKYRSTPAKLMRDLQLCLEPSFETRPDFYLEFGQRTGIPDFFDPPADDDRKEQRRQDIFISLCWAAATIFLIAGIIFLLVALLTRAGLPRSIMPIIALLSVGASLILTRLYHDHLPNLTAKLAFFAGVAVLPPTLIQFIFFNSSS
jgi:hypothetical protein